MSITSVPQTVMSKVASGAQLRMCLTRPVILQPKRSLCFRQNSNCVIHIYQNVIGNPLFSKSKEFFKCLEQPRVCLWQK
jgi:hypothetical protein